MAPTALETRLAALEERLNPSAARQKVRMQEIADANDAFGEAARRRPKIAKDYLAAIAKLREAVAGLLPFSARVLELVNEDEDAFVEQRRAVDQGATGDIDVKIPGASPAPYVIQRLLKDLDDTVALAAKYGVHQR